MKKHVKECEELIKKKLKFPMSSGDITIFVTYLLQKETLKATSIDNMLSALRTWHQEEGYYLSELRPEVIKTLLRGKSNLDAEIAREEGQRQPVYLEHWTRDTIDGPYLSRHVEMTQISAFFDDIVPVLL